MAGNIQALVVGIRCG